jgi:hypothetical protein
MEGLRYEYRLQDDAHKEKWVKLDETLCLVSCRVTAVLKGQVRGREGKGREGKRKDGRDGTGK